MYENNMLHTYQGSVRTSDAMGDVLRSDSSFDTLFSTDAKAGSSMHSKLGWKSILSHGDDLAVADPALAKKILLIEEKLKKQGEWTRLQAKSFEYTYERYVHILTMIRNEIEAEHSREQRLLTAYVNSSLNGVERAVFKERIDAAD